MSPESRGQEMFLLSPRNIFVSLATDFVMRYKVSDVAKLGDMKGTCHAPQYRVKHSFGKAFRLYLCILELIYSYC